MKKELLSVAVDPGPTGGGISVIKENLDILELTTAPFFIVKSTSKQNKLKLNKETGLYEKDYKQRKYTDYTKLDKIYEPYLNNNIIYTIEKVFVKKGEGESGSFVFGLCVGNHQSIMHYLKPVQMYEPLATEWKRDFSLSEDKELSVNLANKIFEKQLIQRLGRLLKFQKSNNNKEVDLAEALLISLWGLLKYKKEI